MSYWGGGGLKIDTKIPDSLISFCSCCKCASWLILVVVDYKNSSDYLNPFQIGNQLNWFEGSLKTKREPKQKLISVIAIYLFQSKTNESLCICRIRKARTLPVFACTKWCRLSSAGVYSAGAEFNGLQFYREMTFQSN